MVNRRIRGVDATEEVAWTHELRSVLLSIPDRLTRHEGYFALDTVPGSQIDIDNKLTSPRQTATAIHTCLNQGFDALRGLHRLLLDGDKPQLFQAAQFPLIRTAIESGSQALWLLQPEDQRERIVRAVMVMESESIYDGRMVDAMASADPGDGRAERSAKASYVRQHQKRRKLDTAHIRSIAGPFQINRPEYASMPTWSEIVGNAASVSGRTPSLARATWQLVSGLTHPSTNRMTMASVIEEVDMGRADKDMFSVLITSDVRLVCFSLALGAHFVTQAEERFTRLRGLTLSA
jgi:hypothetical protein